MVGGVGWREGWMMGQWQTWHCERAPTLDIAITDVADGAVRVERAWYMHYSIPR